MYYYNFNCRADVKWKRPKILNYGLYTQIRNCDKILLLNNGKIDAYGKYNDLENNNEIFKTFLIKKDT